jgi:hypothetical protein
VGIGSRDDAFRDVMHRQRTGPNEKISHVWKDVNFLETLLDATPNSRGARQQTGDGRCLTARGACCSS